MWLTDGFLVTFFGRWWGAVRIHVSHVQLPCGGDIHMWDLLMCGGDIHVWDLLTCAGDIHVWDLLTCGGDIHVCELLTCGGGIHVWDTGIEPHGPSRSV